MGRDMIIYHDTKAGFIRDVDSNALLPRLQSAFRAKTGSVPSDEYVWADEYRGFSIPLRNASVADDVDVAIEYHVSAAGRRRIDVLMTGNDGKTDNAVIIELKAWGDASFSSIAGMVRSPIGGGSDKQHPCVQAANYKGTILKFNEDIRNEGIQVHAAAYLYNLHRRDPEPLEDERYKSILAGARLFLANDVAKLQGFLEENVPKKSRKDVLYVLENGKLRPSDELISRVSSMLEGNEEFILLDEQFEAFQIIRHRVLDVKDRGRHVFIVKGGPGTGKSVIAVRLLAEILKEKRMGFFVAPNAAFRQTLVEYLDKGNKGYRQDGQELMKSSWAFHASDFKKDARHEVLIVDEAHRLKGQGAFQYKGKSMVEDMVRAARISVFFLDEGQRVHWRDIGSKAAIESAAKKYGAELHPSLELTAQFRCGGSDGYINWLDDVLQINPTANFDHWGSEQYEIKVFEKAGELYSALKEKNGENKARLIAGYSWEWPSAGRERGGNSIHVRAGDLALPWNFSGENWATSKDGITQVGCVHTSQGLEFDWLGVLIGQDLAYKDGRVIGVPEKRARTDASLNGWKTEFAAGDEAAKQQVLAKVQEIIKSTYKVLLSRGRKGCYVWCADPALRDYLKERLNIPQGA